MGKTEFQSQWLGGSLQIAGSELVGNCYYVDSTNGASTNSGTSWSNALATVDQAVAKCTANHGDRIYCAPWHAESEAVTVTSIFTMSTAGVSLIGCKQGNQMPTFTFTIADATATVTGANCVVKNCKFVSGIVDLAVALTLGAASDGTVVEDCIFTDGGTAILEMVIGIRLAALASDITINRCSFYTTAAGSGTLAGIEAAGAADRLRITNCVFAGDWNTQAPIDLLTAASVHILIADNIIYQLDAATGYGISVHATTTGSIVRNLIFAGKNTVAAISAAKCHCCENYETTVEAESGNIVPAVGNWAA